MARQLFIAQQTLSTWMDQDKIDFDGDIMTIKADGRRFKLVEAVRFVRVEGDEADTHCLLGKVKTNDQLEQLGAERYRDSVLVEDVAYQAQEGFIGEVFLDRLEAEAQPTCQPEPAAARPAEQPAAETAEQPAAETAEQPAVETAEQPAAVPRPEPAAGERPLPVARTQPALDSVEQQRPAPQRPSDTAPRKPQPAEGNGDLSDEELLTRFLLENL